MDAKIGSATKYPRVRMGPPVACKVSSAVKETKTTFGENHEGVAQHETKFSGHAGRESFHENQVGHDDVLKTIEAIQIWKVCETIAFADEFGLSSWNEYF